MGATTHTPPSPSIAQAWQEVDTSIDEESPELLSADQLDRYVDTVVELLSAAGLSLTKRDTGPEEAELEITNPHLPYASTLELFLRNDRSAEWRLELGDDLLENTPAQAMATLLTSLLSEHRT
ncbi:hypothetical protein RIF23_13425 [Lipingzhangella sp. LS1_29]|uniref:Uncharacterized protein n=1 Tax=Lipingzhangella rawalii TaxID=2055835 RepID=A0ABU2H7L1_9ACTN|nr:hypothetical protein [Lipingzhangella rawalii]MDS1271297.1 hypothetical protein [Lipingzhangella rawalii]